MDDITLEKYLKAGKIASEARNFGASKIVVGVKLIDVCDDVEKKIFELGGVPAFPAQISLNNVAAHYCPEPNDETVFKVDDLAKLDIGVHVDGYVADTAVSIDLGNNKDLVDASRNALNAAIKLAKQGVKTCELGKAIHSEITSLGFSPIKNLSGHGVGKFIIHGPPSIPNYDTKDNVVLEEGMVIAIEPFASMGSGMIHETDNANIFMLIGKKPVRSPTAREILNEIQKYGGLPFTTRWLTKKFPLIKVRLALRELLNAGILRAFSPLPDKGLVSQHEHTLIITKDEPIVITR